MSVRRKIFYPVTFSILLMASSAMAVVDPTAFKGVTEHFLKGQADYTPTLGAIALSTKLIENIRFYGDFEIVFDKNGKRDYVNDKANGPLEHVVKILFPSNNGQLGTKTRATSNFGKYVTKPETVALLLNYAQQVENTKDISRKNTQKFISQIVNTLGPKDDRERGSFTNNIVTPLVNHIRASIELEKKGSSLYPRHTTEQVLSAFFCYHFNTRNDVRELIEHLDKTIVDKTKPPLSPTDHLQKEDLPEIAKKENPNLDDLLALSRSSLFSSITPYESGVGLLTTGLVSSYNREKNVIIKNETFTDCVEMSMRHICNLLLFDPLWRNFNLTPIQGLVEQQEIEHGTKNSYFENFKTFYDHQTLRMANAGEIGTRSLWNTVVAGLPGIKYVGEGNEINSGFINFLNTFKTIFNLNFDELPDTLEHKKAWVEKSFRTLFSALNSSYTYDISLKIEDIGHDLIGNAVITVGKQGNDLFSFDLYIFEKSTQISSLKILAKQDSEDFTPIIENHLSVLRKGTADESFLLLTPTLQNDLPPLYGLYAQPLSDNAAKINFLEKLSDNYDSWKDLPNFKNNLPSLRTMAKNVTRSIDWHDPVIVQKATPLVLNLFKKEGFEDALKNEVRGLSSETLTWKEISDLAEKCPNFQLLDVSQNNEIKDISFTKNFKNLRTFIMKNSGIEKIQDLENLKNLEHLTLTDVKVPFSFSAEVLPALRELDLQNSAITKIDGLDQLSNLNYLNLSETPLQNISLAGLSNLTQLNLAKSEIKSVEGFETLSRLKNLNVSDTSFLESIYLKGASNLEKVNFTGSAVKIIEGLQDCLKLETLPLSGTTQLKNLSVEGLLNLHELDLSGSSLRELKGLEDLPQLKRIDLSNTSQLGKVSLKNLQNLTFLSCEASVIKDIEGLEDLSKLEVLNLSNTSQLGSISLRGLDNLTFLNLGNSVIHTIEKLNHLSKLTNLDLEGNSQLKEISLKGLTSLEKFSCGSAIEKIEELEGLLKLTFLSFLNASKLDEISLKNLPQLNSLNFTGSSIKKVTGLRDMPNLEALDFTNTAIEEIETLEGLPNLKTLTLSQKLQDTSLKHLSSLTSLSYADSSITELKDLPSLSNLRQLSLASASLLEKIDLKELSNLEFLNFNNSAIKEIEGLDKLSNLQRLMLSNTSKLEALDLRGISNLRMLDLRGSAVKSVKIDQDMKNLTIMLRGSTLKNSDIDGFEHLSANRIIR